MGEIIPTVDYLESDRMRRKKTLWYKLEEVAEEEDQFNLLERNNNYGEDEVHIRSLPETNMVVATWMQDIS